MGVESTVVPQHAPGNAGELVGQGNCQFVLVQPLCRVLEPCPEAISRPILWAHQEDFRGLDEERPQVFAAVFRDAAQNRPSTRAVLSGNKAEPGTKVAPAFESLTRADRGHQSGRDQRPDTGHAHQPPAVSLAAAESFDHSSDRLDTLVQPEPVFMKADNQIDHAARYLVFPILQYLEERFTQGTRSRP